MHGMKHSRGGHRMTRHGRSRFGDDGYDAMMRGGPGGNRGGHPGRGGHGGPHGGGGRRGKRFGGEELRLMVLGLLAEEPRHGYQLIRAFAERSGESYSPSPGVLYPLLTMLAEMGLVEEVAGEGSGRRRYAVTAAGHDALAAGKAELDAALARLAAMASDAARTDGGPLRRAMMNLRMAASQRLDQDREDGELVHRIAALLDETARQIERL